MPTMLCAVPSEHDLEGSAAQGRGIAERRVVLQMESLQAENEAHIEARNFEAARCRKFEAFLKADAEELAQRVSQESP